MATIGDVARRAGVSTTLVSRYLNGVKGVSPASKEKIEGAIRELNYVPDESARMLVRRRGGGTAVPGPTQGLRDTLPTAIAMLCEDADFRLLSACYLGAKHALWANEQFREVRILLFCIPDDANRAAEEEAALSYLTQICRGILTVGASDALNERLQPVSEQLPVVSLHAQQDAKQLSHTSPELRSFCSALEADSADAILHLCAKLTENDNTAERRTVSAAYALTLTEEPEKDHSPVGRRLQSHLL